ncbi:3-phenylpropionate/cinnamic acid dioxygenase subunit beta [Parapusillimonas granuli]|uniref:3-phenylpropionate/cinnamic acid dioxygenase subunit beta n=1 Tax=Parapusillimonas granuli TaxID=380911 RepID=A0A853G476_9BURK|nr:3-phenylpropionate/cinnamic acid dioxygenase subunit beta [Parapusillimonas granuli]MBB5215523.1 3-phenylpropionate/cinnamic acid dioxygenase small subunit [Parapusillimonas granuli]NYT49810.1 3-phenylpropionate/cinnamic acid dioxygenase subunit beta [Parapusillimonas granuli]
MNDNHTETSQPEAAYVRASMDLWWEIQNFLFEEAELLDTRRFSEWLELLHPDIQYRMPLARNIRRDHIKTQEYTRPGEAAWFDEGYQTLSQRVAQINTGIHWAEEPASRISHLIGNVQVWAPAEAAGAPDEVKVRSRFLVYQNRLQTETSLFVGKRDDILRRHEGRWKIAERTLYLDQNVLLAKALTTFF